MQGIEVAQLTFRLLFLNILVIVAFLILIEDKKKEDTEKEKKI